MENQIFKKSDKKQFFPKLVLRGRLGYLEGREPQNREIKNSKFFISGGGGMGIQCRTHGESHGIIISKICDLLKLTYVCS